MLVFNYSFVNLIMASKHKRSDAGNLYMPKRSLKVLPLREKRLYVWGGNSIYRVWYYPRFQASTVGLGTDPPQIGEDYCT